VRVEHGPDVRPDELPALRERIVRRVRDLLVFTPNVELVAPGSLPRTERKAKRLNRLYQGERP
jgi:phenylacetate-CoA ligase